MSKAVSEDIGIARLYLSKMEQARARNIHWGLTFAEYKRLRRRKTCYYTGDTLEPSTYGETRKPNAFTLDRIDASIGYTPENTVVCSELFNSFKASFEKGDKATIELLVRGCNKFLDSISLDYGKAVKQV